MPRPNIYSSAFEYDPEDPNGYRCGYIHLTRAAEGKDLAVKYYDIPSGESLCPYHYEFEEEWLFVVSGQVELKTPEGTVGLDAGTVVCFPKGPAGAHKVSNYETDSARVLMFSSSREPAVAVYPDSDKIGVWPGNDEDKVMLRREDGQVSYYDGEV